MRWTHGSDVAPRTCLLANQLFSPTYREFDSTDEFDDTLPVQCDPKDFFKVGEVWDAARRLLRRLAHACHAYGVWT